MVDCVAAVDVLKRLGIRRIAVCSTLAGARAGLPDHPAFDRAAIIPDVTEAGRDHLRRAGWRAFGLTDVPSEIGGLVISDFGGFRGLMRLLEPLSRRNYIILPADPDWVVPRPVREGDAMYAAWNTSAAANYVARCNLRGHYLEFGTFWGGSFFPNYFRFRHWLHGNFLAFDSFQGLSEPRPNETRFTGGDFAQAAYCSNERSFIAMGELLGVAPERLRVVGGFFSQTLEGVPAQTYGLTPGSVSVCYIDCDLKDPTKQVLAFVAPVLEEGALVYFDDWRLCRASGEVGERAAALEWLDRNPGFELIEFDRDHWQHQWFIFQRRAARVP